MKLGTKNEIIPHRDGPEHLLTVHNKNNARGWDKDFQDKEIRSTTRPYGVSEYEQNPEELY